MKLPIELFCAITSSTFFPWIIIDPDAAVTKAMRKMKKSFVVTNEEFVDQDEETNGYDIFMYAPTSTTATSYQRIGEQSQCLLPNSHPVGARYDEEQVQEESLVITQQIKDATDVLSQKKEKRYLSSN